MNSSPIAPRTPIQSLAGHFDAFQRIDRRIIYIFVFLLLLFPLLVGFELPINVSPEVQAFYDSVNAAPKDKPILFSLDWGAGTRGENEPQSKAVLEHLFRDNRKVVFVTFDPQGAEFSDRIARPIAAQYKKKYGEDYVNLGFKALTPETAGAIFQAFAKDFRAIFPRDSRSTLVDTIPIMKNVRSIKDVALITEFTGSSYMDYYVQFIYGPYKVPMVQGCTAIIGPEQYPRLRAGQLRGLLVGMSGAAEYEKLIKVVGQGSRAMNSQSLGHLLIMMLIVLGNLGTVTRRMAR